MALHARIQADILPARWNVKPFGLNVQLQHGESIPHVGGKEYGTALGLTARGESQTASRPDLFRHLCVAKPRHTRGIPPVRRLDLTAERHLRD